jgi:hypothetical protein
MQGSEFKLKYHLNTYILTYIHKVGTLLTPVIPASQKVAIGRIEFGGQPRQKAGEISSQHEKDGYGGMCLLSQLLRRGKKEDHGLAQSLQK